MNMEFDHDAWPIGQGQGGESDAFQGRLDWHGLRARFLAVRSYRQALGPCGAHSGAAVDASFDRSAARALAQFEDAPHFEASRAVNLNNSADGKGRFGMGEDVAGAPQPGVARPGDRG